MAVALWLTRGRRKTFPVLQLDGEAIGDSTAIIAALERRYPDPPLYPEDPGERRRALELEEFFDEELGPHARLLAFHEATKDPAIVERFTVDLLPGRLADIGPVRAGATRFFSTFTGPSLRGEERSPGGAREGQDPGGVRSARIRARLGRYLVGDRFTVADLTAASLLYPLVQPPEGPVASAAAARRRFERFRAPLAGAPGLSVGGGDVPSTPPGQARLARRTPARPRPSRT